MQFKPTTNFNCLNFLGIITHCSCCSSFLMDVIAPLGPMWKGTPVVQITEPIQLMQYNIILSTETLNEF